MAQAELAKPAATVVFRVEGITCLDCAAKFEENVGGLPGVASATLNSMAGKLTVEGVADLRAIREEAKKEGYQVTPLDEKRVATAGVRRNWALLRTLISALAFAAAYALSRAGAASDLSVPLYIVAMLVGGWGNLRRARYSLPRLEFNMSVMMASALIGAAAIGQWEEGAGVAFLYSVSELLESWTMEQGRRSLRQLINLAPRMARIRRGVEDVEVPAEDVRVGDVMLLRPGEKIAMDGRILKGESAVNQAAITGESVPVEKGPGDELFAGTFNTHGSLEVEVTKRVEDTTLVRIIHLVEDAQAKRAPSQAFVDRFARVYTPVVLALAALVTLVPPLLLGYDWSAWLYRGLALLVVSCPCALVVSTPVTIVSAISNAARNGVLIKGGMSLEAAGAVRAVAFDKTGTLSRGRPVVTDLVPLGSISERDLLQLAADLEARSEHPLSEAIVRAAEAQGLRPQAVEGFSARPGRGVQGAVDGETLYVGNLRLFEDLGISTEAVSEAVRRLQGEGKTVMVVGTAASFLGIVAVADEIREMSRSAVAQLKRAGVGRTVMLTGDNEATARAVASRVGVDEFRAELLPHEKVEYIEGLLAEHGKVAMVGDGINDAPALATATVGIAMGGAGSDTALETADVVLMADDLSKLPFTVRLSRMALTVIKQNITFSLVIKAIAVAAVFPGWLTLWLAVLADVGATVLVTLNGMRLLRVKPEK